MTAVKYTYKLRLKRQPEKLRMDRLAEYMREFAKLLGLENNPVFKGIKRNSTGVRALVPQACEKATAIRIHKARNEPDSQPAKQLRSIADMIAVDKIEKAELRDRNDRVIYAFTPEPQSDVSATVWQEGDVDGTMTGIVGADDTMHLHIRNHCDRDLRLVVKDEDMAKALLTHFREGIMRLRVRGTWKQTDLGWVPDSRCVVTQFVMLDEEPLDSVFATLSEISENGWLSDDDPLASWRDLRGIH